MIPRDFPVGTTFTVPLWSQRPKSFLLEEYRKGAWSFDKGYRMKPETNADRAFGNIAPLFRYGVLVSDLLRAEKMYHYAGLDLSGTKRPGNALVVVGVDPTSGLRVIRRMGLWRGAFEEINSRVVESNAQFHWQVLSVENNGVQDQIESALRFEHPDLPIAGFLTSNNKAHPEYGVRGLAAEIKQGAWALCMDDAYDTEAPLSQHHPECSCAYHTFIQDLVNYPSEGRAYDLLMAWWFAREAVRGAVDALEKHRAQEATREEGGMIDEGVIPADELGGAFIS